MTELDTKLKEVILNNVPSADLHKFADELDFLEQCERDHEDRLQRSFTNEIRE